MFAATSEPGAISNFSANKVVNLFIFRISHGTLPDGRGSPRPPHEIEDYLLDLAAADCACAAKLPAGVLPQFALAVAD